MRGWDEGEGVRWRFRGLGEGERRCSVRASRRLGVDPEGERDLLRFFAGSSLVALKGWGWSSTGEISAPAILIDGRICVSLGSS